MSETGNGRYLPLLPSRLLRSATKSTNGDVTEANYPMKRVMTSALAVGAVVGAASLMVPATASAAPVSSANCARIATPTAPNGWGNSFGDEQGQAGKITATNVSDDDGSLEFATSPQVPRQASYHSAGKLPLTQLAGKPLTFQKSTGNANWQIRVTGANTGEGNGFATLVWSASDAAGAPDAASSDQWWATRSLGTIPRGQTGTLAELTTAANSGGKATVVEDYGISSQPNGGTGTVHVDNVTFNGCTTNFAVRSSNGSLGGIQLPSFGSS